MAKVSKDHVDKWFDYDIDLDNRTIWIGSIEHEDDDESGVNAALSEQVIKGLHLLERADPEGNKPITVFINTPGGSEFEGLAIYDALKSCKSHVTGIVYSKAWSMGSYILQACDERIMAPSSSIMIHEGTLDLPPNEHPRIVKAWFKHYFDVIEPRLDNILLERIREKQPDFQLKKLKEYLKFDTIFTPEQSIELGLADKILDEDD